MPRISQAILDSIFYLYPSVDAAENGEHYGGTGFLVAYLPERSFNRSPPVYGVTNWHIVKHSPVIRLNASDGQRKVIDLDPSDWDWIADGDDIAAVLLPRGLHLEEFIKHQPIASSMFTTHQVVRDTGIGVGDDVFMVGRFIEHDGGVTNQPAARFGNISVMPTPILQPNNRKRDCYIIDMHSRTGYSGSPVFVYRTFGQDLAGADFDRLLRSPTVNTVRDAVRPHRSLLGIHCAQFPEQWPIEDHQIYNHVRDPRPHVVGMSGMTIVVPAWRITELLESPRLELQRSQIG